MGVMLSSSCVVSAAPSSSHSSPAPAWGPSHGRQSSTNWSSVGRPTGCSPSGRGCSSIGGHKPCQQSCSSMGSLLSTGPHILPGVCSNAGSPWDAACFGHPPAPAWGPPRAAGGDLLYHGPPQAAGAQPASRWSSLWAGGESLLQCLELLLPLLHGPWCLQSCFSHMFSLLSSGSCWC